MRAQHIPFALFGFLLISTISGKAFSADRAEPSQSWSGYYAGLNIGAANNDDAINSDFSYGAYHAPVAFRSTVRATPIGGAHVGYQKSLNQWILGAEADINLTNAKHHECRGAFELDKACPDQFYGSVTIDDRTKQLGSIRLKAGHEVYGSLVYLTAGLAVVRSESLVSILCPEGCGLSDAVPTSSATLYRQTLTAPTYGAGLDYKLGQHWVTGIQYQRFSLPRTHHAIDRTASYGPQRFATSTQNSFDSVQVRLSYLF